MDLELSPAATNIVTTVAVGVILCSLAIWIVVIGRLIRRQPILPLRARRPVPWGLVHVGIIGLVYVGLEIAAVVWVGRQAGVPAGQSVSMEALGMNWMPVLLGATAAAKVMALAFGAAVLYLFACAKADDLGFGMKSLGSQILLGIVAFVAIAPPVFAIQMLTQMVVEYKHPLIEFLKAESSVDNLLLTTVLAVLVAPPVEEFLFRLVLQGWLQRFEWFNRGGPRLAAEAVGEKNESVETATFADVEPAAQVDGNAPSSPENPLASPAPLRTEPPMNEAACDPNNVPMRPVLPLLGVVPICISSLVFAMMHVGQGAAPIPLFVLALGLGYLYQRTGRLLPCILVHMLLNGTSMAILWLTLYGTA